MLRFVKSTPWLYCLVVFFIWGCVTKSPRAETPMADSSPSISPAPSIEPQPPAVEPPVTPVSKKRIGLVLGGAGVASFATVGILKRFQQEGIGVDFIVTTGWPTLFSLGYGFLKSVHDLEWFAMRLQDKDFYAAGFFDSGREFASHDKLSKLVSNAFKQDGIEDSKIPIIISAANIEPGDPDVYERGDWKNPLLKTMSVPGIYRPYPQDSDNKWVSSLQGLDVAEAIKRGPDLIVAVSMYDDYFALLKKNAGKKEGTEALFRQLYLTQLRNTIAREFKLAQLTSRIQIDKNPNDFTAKRAAILAGYKEGSRLAREIRRLVRESE